MTIVDCPEDKIEYRDGYIFCMERYDLLDKRNPNYLDNWQRAQDERLNPLLRGH